MLTLLLFLRFLNCALNLFIFKLADMRSISGKWVWRAQNALSIAQAHYTCFQTNTFWLQWMANFELQFFVPFFSSLFSRSSSPQISQIGVERLILFASTNDWHLNVVENEPTYWWMFECTCTWSNRCHSQTQIHEHTKHWPVKEQQLDVCMCHVNSNQWIQLKD